MSENSCRFTEHTLDHGMRAVTLENDILSVTLLPEKGADIYSLVYKPREMDVLWKAPWGLKRPGTGFHTAGENTEVIWMDHYTGGWQEIFPNGGDECTYKGGLLCFHGEVSTLPWDYTVTTSSSDKLSVEFCVRLYRSPFSVRRTVTVERGLAAVLLSEKITNEAEEEMHFMWGHHPAYGAPFLSEDCRIQVPAKTFKAHDVEIAPTGRFAGGTEGDWPLVKGKDGSEIDLSVMPDTDIRTAELGYLCDLDDGWYAITNQAHDFGIGLAWPEEIFSYLWFWKELKGSFGYPWYGNAYVMALEPFTSIPGSGLVNAIEKGTARLLNAGESIEADLAAVFFEGTGEIQSISRDGTVAHAQG